MHTVMKAETTYTAINQEMPKVTNQPPEATRKLERSKEDFLCRFQNTAGPCWHLHLVLLAFKTGRQYISCFKPPICGALLWSLLGHYYSNEYNEIVLSWCTINHLSLLHPAHFVSLSPFHWTSLVALWVKNLPVMQETQVQFLCWEIPWRRKWQPTSVFLPG